jgi:abortive infection bacteriophage resistance protein
MNYNKPPISIQQQIELLKKRGLIFKNEKRAAHYLSNISYYRLRAYTYPFQNNNDSNHPFNKSVCFEEIIELYVFDRHLRQLVFDALEKIEIAFRTKIIYEYALTYGSHWHENAVLYRDNNRFIRDLNKLYEEVDRSTETFIKHYKSIYTNPANPASWMSLEVASIGMLSKLFENLKRGPEKKSIALAFGLNNSMILESWMHSFSHLRNICAHHSRLWNRRLTTIPQIPHNTVHPFLKNKTFYANKLYGTLCCMTYILHIISPGNNFNGRLSALMKSCALIDLKEMGFPSDWHTELLWKS